jgi:hypothetical protein
VRGLKWRGKRPDLIVGDDLENDEIVMNPERREKFRRWFMNALIPCGSDNCWIRIVGTILHLDSMLQRLIEDNTWTHFFYQAHNPDFSEILWPEQFSRERLEKIRAGYQEQNDLDGYSQEYLNRPVASGNAFFNPDYGSSPTLNTSRRQTLPSPRRKRRITPLFWLQGLILTGLFMWLTLTSFAVMPM